MVKVLSAIEGVKINVQSSNLTLLMMQLHKYGRSWIALIPFNIFLSILPLLRKKIKIIL